MNLWKNRPSTHDGLLDTLCDYVEATVSSRNMIEGQEIISTRLIVMCGATAKTTDNIELYSLWMQTSDLTQPPHQITGWLKITSSGENDVDVETTVTIQNMQESAYENMLEGVTAASTL